MAERRMFAKTVIDSDAFLDMPLSTQALYFHLSMRGDDDGFINNPKKVQRMIGCNDDDLKLLIAKNFIIPFESGIVVIKHWKIHNYIQKDRYKATVYQDEAKLLQTKKNNAYTLDTGCIQDGYTSETQVRLGKDSIGKSKVRDNIVEQVSDKNTLEVEVEIKKKIEIQKELTPLEVVLNDYYLHRKQIKSPMTDRAKELLLKKIDKLASNDADKIAILEQSIENGWKGVFELNKPQDKMNGNKAAKEFAGARSRDLNRFIE